MSKKTKIYPSSVIVFILLLFSLSFNPASGQKKSQEEVIVTAIEVPVRVFHKGQAVKGLTKSDFEIYENGIRQEITAFEVVSRKISFLGEIPEIKARPKKRFFILIFNIFDFTEAVGEGIDDFFQNYFTKGDSLLVITEDRMLDMKKGENLSETIENLKQTLKKYKIISTHNILKTFRDLRYEADRLLRHLRGEQAAGIMSTFPALAEFFDHYQRVCNDYRRQFLIPDVDAYQTMLRRIKQMEGEKWAICFQQREIFPQLKNASRLDNEIRKWIDSQIEPQEQVKARMVQAKQREMQRSLGISENLPSERLRQLFMEANITFHLILSRSFRSSPSQDFELKEVGQDYEDCFRKISSATGGLTYFSNKVTEALREAAETEDYYYLLVYSPQDKSEKARDIEVKVDKPEVDTIYLQHIPEFKVPPITITDFKTDKKTIKFSLINYEMTKVDGKLRGIADVKITLFDEASKKVFDQGKTLNLSKKETSISLNFGHLKSGSFFIIIQAIDKISEETHVFSRAIKL